MRRGNRGTGSRARRCSTPSIAFRSLTEQFEQPLAHCGVCRIVEHEAEIGEQCLGDGLGAAAEKPLDDLVERQIDAVRGEAFLHDPCRQWFAIRNDAIAIKNDQPNVVDKVHAGRFQWREAECGCRASAEPRECGRLRRKPYHELM